MFFVPAYIFRYVILTDEGWDGDLWTLSVTAFTSIYFVVTLKLLNFIRFYTIFHFIAIFLCSFLVYYSYVWVSNYLTFSYTYSMIGVLHTSPLFYLTVLLVGGGTFVIDMFIHAF